jgi:hypothetical protein
MGNYVTRNGRRIEVVTINPTAGREKPKRKRFKAEWVKLPLHWADMLRRAKRISTYQMALLILFEAFKCERIGGEIVLSAEITKMNPSTRFRAAKELVELGLIEVERKGKQTLKVSMIR